MRFYVTPTRIQISSRELTSSSHLGHLSHLPFSISPLLLVSFVFDLFLHTLTPPIVTPTRLEQNTLGQVHVHDLKLKFNTVTENSGAQFVRVATTDLYINWI